MASPRTALPANSAERTRRPSGRPLTYRGSHRTAARVRRRTASVLAVAVCAGLPAGGTFALRDTPAHHRPHPAAATRAVSASQPVRPARQPVVAVPASAAPRRRLVGFRTSVQEVPGRSFRGRATWYGPGFHGRRTANGERFDQLAMTAAHRTLPFGTRLRVCTRGRCVVVRINDRGPFGAGNVLDLSKGAARRLGTERSGVAYVTATSLHTRTVKVPVYAAAPKAPAWTLRAERLSRPDPSTAGADAVQGDASPELQLVGEQRRWSALASAGVGVGGLLLLGLMALPAWLQRRRKGLTFARTR